MKSILVTGCNRGLGLGLVKNLADLRKPPDNIFATCRNTKKAPELRSLARKSPNIHILEIDLLDTDNYDKIIDVVSEKTKTNGLNVLLNNAAVSNKFTRIGLVKKDKLIESFLVNTVAPIMLTKGLLPLLRIAAKNSSELGLNTKKAAIVNITSLLGSISENQEGGFYPFRCSKAALNAATKSISLDLQSDGIMAVCFHPGRLRPEMGGNNATQLDIDTSAKYILTTLDSLNEKHNGCFLQYDGKSLPW